MFTTALKDIKCILAEFWMKEIEMKAEEFSSHELCYFLWGGSLRRGGRKKKLMNGLAGNGYSVWLSCPYSEHSND